MHRCLLLVVGSQLLPAQTPHDKASRAAAKVTAESLRVPLHTAPDDPAGGAYGIWTAGASFKASFHDGFAFYPYIPGQQRARALRWRATEVSVGGERLALPAAQATTTAWRYELRSGAITEAYDVREDGVEQSFVVHTRPTGDGELVVAGRIDTPFRAKARTAEVAPLIFHDDDGAPALTYGRALAFDAAGRRTDVPVSFDGTTIRLHVAADFVAAATFPLTIDPLTSAVVANFDVGAPIIDTAVACSWQQGDFNMLVACVREFAANDLDAFAYRTSDMSTTAGTLIFSDVTTAWSTPSIDAAVVSAELAWVLGLQRNFPSRAVRLYTHSITSSTLNSGVTYFPSAAIERAEPNVGGSHGAFVAGRHALLVFTEYPSGAPEIAKGLVLDAQAGTLGPDFDLYVGAPPNRINRSPAVNASAHVTSAAVEPWCVTWVEDNGAGAFDVKVSMVSTSGAPTNTQTVLSGPSARGPRIAGADGGYVLTWIETPGPFASALRAARIAMTPSSYARLADRTLTTTSAGRLLLAGDVAFDFITKSHYAVTYGTAVLLGSSMVHVARVGLELTILETSALDTTGTVNASNSDVAFTGEPHPSTRAGFPCTYTTDERTNPLRWRRLDYAPAAANTIYGASCRNNPLYGSHPPYAGSSYFTLNVSGLPANTPAFLFLGFTPLDVPLDSIGMTSCRLLLDSVLTVGASATSGIATVPLPLRENPVFIGDLYAQWAWLESGANPLGLVNSRGLQIAVR